jgi:amino acid permease
VTIFGYTNLCSKRKAARKGLRTPAGTQASWLQYVFCHQKIEFPTVLLFDETLLPIDATQLNSLHSGLSSDPRSFCLISPAMSGRNGDGDETTALLSQTAGIVTHPDTSSAFPRELSKLHQFCIMFNQAGLAFFVTAGPILKTGGKGALMFAPIFLGLLVLLVNQAVVRMLRIWRISTSSVVLAQTFLDPHLGIVIGWLSWTTLECCMALLTVEVISLVETLEMSRGTTVIVCATTITAPILLNLMDIRWFIRFQMWLTAIQLFAAITIFGIMLHVNASVVRPKHPPVSENDTLFPGNGLAENMRGLLFAMYMLGSLLIGVETLSLVAPELDLERPGLNDRGEGHVSDDS